MPDPRRLFGEAGERAAEKFLRRRRYVIVDRNYRCHAGEIDLVALHRGTVVFVEVKARAQDGFGSPLDAVGPRKQRRIIRAARHFIARHHLDDRDVRFDVVGVWCDGGRMRCEVVQNAFEVEPSVF